MATEIILRPVHSRVPEPIILTKGLARIFLDVRNPEKYLMHNATRWFNTSMGIELPAGHGVIVTATPQTQKRGFTVFGGSQMILSDQEDLSVEIRNTNNLAWHPVKWDLSVLLRAFKLPSVDFIFANVEDVAHG
jgi:hypothetical protein